MDQEAEGIKAIQFLQGIVGITETYEQAKVGWRRMSIVQQANTMQAYSIMLPRKRQGLQ